ncbi:hypothetical protein ABII15_20745 [Streptomyces sp. HUAS MG91]|uniref:Uncharacterized protein n=1 Tax=Streptomyces tabacisoli TaxID=3156398 RepID=A0AAU8IWV4_9ACTN
MNTTVHRHSGATTDPAGTGLALAVASTLFPPVTRAPEVATAAAPRRAARGRRAAVRG